MFSTDDTIVAIATPPGRGGIGVVRVSGPDASGIASRLLKLEGPLQPRRATFARTDHDQVVATYFPAPHSYTADDVVEIAGHGSPLLLREIVAAAIRAGARLAEPGEFTLRAFLNGRIDLVQAEAIADLIEAVTPLQARAAFDQLEGTLTERIAQIDAEMFDLIARLEASLDFPDEGYHFIEPAEVCSTVRAIDNTITTLLCQATRGRLIREGARVSIAGKANVGKSSLFNALLDTGRAIVTAIPGTTRDLLTETADIDGLKLEITDTAGMRATADEVETEGVARARRAWSTGDLTLLVLDLSRPRDDMDDGLLEETAGLRRIVVANKTDLAAVWDPAQLRVPVVRVSAVTGAGIDMLRSEIRGALENGSQTPARDGAAVTNVRHAALLDRAHAALSRAAAALDTPDQPVPEEFVLTDLQDARAALEEVTGKRTSEDLLRHIFARFCIGK